ncbi:MAG TPA: molybdate ABC transporter substrate-binding protein [Thermodesulfovibrionales bacterium]|jgi:molybdate transport system substrate-binding protein|nr:molybdate ABC transporter substrate-binding protein [Thermodesulfovibrionales bacterium]
MKAKYLYVLFFFMSVSFMLQHVAVAERTREITVSAAISLKKAFEEIGRLYESKHKGLRVSFNFGASGDLMRQIEGGAPVDVFASAAQKDMDEAEKKGLILSGSRADFAANAVVLVAPATAKMPIKSFEDLKTDSIKKIAVGNSKTVPAGRYAEEVFHYYRIFDTIKDRLILTENVRQALDYVARGEVDAGVVYATDAMTRPKEVSIVATAPEESHKPVVYPIAVVKDTRNEAAAKDFIALVLSPEGQKILEKYGFKKQ